MVSRVARVWREDVQASSCNKEQRHRLDLCDYLCSQISLKVQCLRRRCICVPSREPLLLLQHCIQGHKALVAWPKRLKGKFCRPNTCEMEIPFLRLYIITLENLHMLASSVGQVLIYSVPLCGPNITQLQGSGRINLPAQFSLEWLYL